MAFWWLCGQYQNSLLFADFVLRCSVHYDFHKCPTKKPLTMVLCTRPKWLRQDRDLRS
jgi:hypothetical protein